MLDLHSVWDLWAFTFLIEQKYVQFKDIVYQQIVGYKQCTVLSTFVLIELPEGFCV